MAHYAYINADNVVVEVINGIDENETVDGISDWETYYQTKRPGLICKRTSYNTYIDDAGISRHRGSGEPFRGTYASVGFTYDPVNDVFVLPPNPPAPPEV